MPTLRCCLIFVSYFICFFYFSATHAEVNGHHIQIPALQLANNYHTDIKLQDYWISEKLDGVRAYWDGQQFISKQGNTYQAPTWFVRDFPSFALDGELWLARAKFDELSGIVRKQTPADEQWKKVTYQVFDLPESDENFDSRLAYLKNYFSMQTLPTWLKLITQYKVKTEEELIESLNKVEALQGEGLMLHKGSSYYHAGRDDDLLKLKTYQDAEARVIGHLPGKGKYNKALGALLVEAVNSELKGKKFKIGTGFSDEERKNPPELGNIITYKYFGLTSKGLPRFASFMRIREGFKQ